MSLFIPCTPDGQAFWEQRTALDGRDYILRFAWSQRGGYWTLSVADQDDVAIVNGVALVTGAAPLYGVIDTRRPPGELIVVDALGANDLDPGFDDLGSRFRLVYVTAAELAA